MNKKEYQKYVSAHAPSSNFFKNFFYSFLIGGSICVLGQILKNVYLYLKIDEDTASILVSISLILISCILTSFGLYDRIAKKAGAGTLVPITGFANSIISSAIDNKAEGFILGLASKIFIIAGPVIVYGILSSTIYGIIYAIFIY